MESSQKWLMVENGLRFFKQEQKKQNVVEILPVNAKFVMKDILDSVDWNASLVSNTIRYVFMKGSDISWKKFVDDFAKDVLIYQENKADNERRRRILERTVKNK